MSYLFDIKFGKDFRRKARFVACSHMTETPLSLTYSSVVSRDSIRITLLVVALNNIQLQSLDIQNAYLTADCHELIWTRAGPEFGTKKGH